MLVRKGGISREIDEKRLQEYKDKGFELVEPVEETKKAKQPKQPKEPKMPDGPAAEPPKE